MSDRTRTIVVLVLALIAALISYRSLAGLKEMTTVVVAVTDIVPGLPIQAEMLKTITVSKQEQERLTPLAVHEASQVLGRASKRLIPKGTVLILDPDDFRLTREVLEKAADGTVPPAYLIPFGRVAIAIPVEADSSVGYALKKGDFVQVIWTGTSGKEIIAKTILAQAEVFDTGRDQGSALGGDARGSFKTVTLIASPEDAERVALAKRSGKVDLALIGK